MATFGRTSVTSPDNMPWIGAAPMASKATVAEAGTITSISLYAKSGAPTTAYLGIYSNNAGSPGTLLASSASTVSITTEAWYTADVSYEFTAGTYWLAWFNDAGQIQAFNWTSAGSGAWSVGATWPSWSGAEFYGQDVVYAIYATYTPPAVIAPLEVVMEEPQGVLTAFGNLS